MVVENAYGRLKGRWRRLLKSLDSQPSNIVNVIGACCVLHNLCEIKNEFFDDEWIQEVEQEQNHKQQMDLSCPDVGHNAEEIRNVLVAHFDS